MGSDGPDLEGSELIGSNPCGRMFLEVHGMVMFTPGLL